MRKIFSRPVKSISNPLPNSSMGTTFPWISTLPSVGFKIPEITFSMVLFPAPFRPISPSVSPFLTSKLTWFSAVNSSYFSFPRSAVVTNSFSDKILSLFIRNRMVTSSTRITIFLPIYTPYRYRTNLSWFLRNTSAPTNSIPIAIRKHCTYTIGSGDSPSKMHSRVLLRKW